MKNKLMVVIAMVTLLTIATVAMASGSLTLEPIVKPADEFAPSFDRLANYMGYDTEEAFHSFHKTALFLGRYCPTEDSFSFIEQMILSGCDPQTTMDIYQFYLTTNEPISIVKQIYDMVYNGEPITNRDVVFENAFNKITNNKCGVLTEDDVVAYLEKGLSVDDIMQANLLSRKAVMTIQEILDASLSGINLEKIEISISKEVTAESNVKEATAVNTILLTDNSNTYFEQNAKKVNSILKEKGYWKGKKSPNFNAMVKEAEKDGITEEKITELLDSGYSELDIFNALKQPDCTAKTIDALTEKEVLKK